MFLCVRAGERFQHVLKGRERKKKEKEEKRRNDKLTLSSVSVCQSLPAIWALEGSPCVVRHAGSRVRVTRVVLLAAAVYAFPRNPGSKEARQDKEHTT